MNTARIITSVATIDESQRALEWLREFGEQLTGRNDAASATISLSFAGSILGAKDAAKVLSAYATLSLPDLVRQSIQSCENTIAMCADAIREEIGSAQ